MNQSSELQQATPTFPIEITKTGKTTKASAPTLGLSATAADQAQAISNLQAKVDEARKTGHLKQD